MSSSKNSTAMDGSWGAGIFIIPNYESRTAGYMRKSFSWVAWVHGFHFDAWCLLGQWTAWIFIGQPSVQSAISLKDLLIHWRAAYSFIVIFLSVHLSTFPSIHPSIHACTTMFISHKFKKSPLEMKVKSDAAPPRYSWWHHHRRRCKQWSLLDFHLHQIGNRISVYVRLGGVNDCNWGSCTWSLCILRMCPVLFLAVSHFRKNCWLWPSTWIH